MDGLLGRFNNWADKTLGNAEGLLGDPVFNMGVGLLANSGPSLQPTSFGRSLAGASNFATNKTAQYQQLQARKQQMEMQKRQQEARKQYQGLLSNPASSIPPSIRAPGAVENEQAQMMGLLAQGWPEQYGQAAAQGLLAQPTAPRTSAAMNDWVAMGGNPQDMEGFAAFKQGPTDPLRDAQLTKLMADMQADIEKRQKEDKEERTEEQIVTIGIESGVADMIKLFDVNSKLEDSPLQSGVPMSDMRRAFSGGIEALSDMFGMDDSGASDLNEQFDLFRKISSDFAVNSQDRLSGSGSNFRLQSTLDANANLSAAPAANRYVIASNLKELMAQARARGVIIPDEQRRAAQKIIDSVFSVSETSGGSVVPPPPGFTED